MDLYFASNPSQKQLQELEASLDALKDKKFILRGKNIVAADEHEADFERD